MTNNKSTLFKTSQSLRLQKQKSRSTVIPVKSKNRPQRSCGQGYVFTRVCDSVHRGVCFGACWDTTPWEGGTPSPQEETPPGKEASPGGNPPGRRHPHPSPQRRPPAYGIRSMSGRYASYWNAFLFLV